MSRRRSRNPRSSATVTRQRSSKHAAERSRTPRLTADRDADDSHLGGLLDELITADDNYKRLTRQILAAQDRLQALCNEDAWVAFLDTEQLVTARANVTSLLIARWAFTEGRRQPRGGR